MKKVSAVTADRRVRLTTNSSSSQYLKQSLEESLPDSGALKEITSGESLIKGGNESPPSCWVNNSSTSGTLILPVSPPLKGKIDSPFSAGWQNPLLPTGHDSLGIVDRVTDTTPKIGYNSLRKLEKLNFDNPLMKYHDLAKGFCQYLKDCQERNIRITGYNTKTGKMVTVDLDYDNRWNPNTRKKLSNKLDQLEYWFNLQSGRDVTLISLTSDHKESIREQWEKLNCSRTLLLKLIRKYFGDVDYFWVAEPQQSGYAHYHLVVFAKIDNEHRWFQNKHGIDWFRGDIKIEDKFREYWSEKYKIGSHTYGLDFMQRLGDNPLNKLKDYLTKYLRKGFALDDWSPAHLVFNALLWDTGFRLYGASKRISAIMKTEPQPQRETVWLNTEIDMGEGEPITRHGRLYIPEWLDSDFWLTPEGHILTGDASPNFVYDWGRGPHPTKWEKSLPKPRIENENPVSFVVHHWQARGTFTDEMVRG